MAGFADALIAGAQQAGNDIIKNDTPDIGNDIAKGLQLAQHVEQVQMQRQELERKKEEHQLAKIDRLTGAYEAAGKIKSPSAKRAFLNNYIPRLEKALKLEGLISDDVKAMVQADPEQLAKIQGLVRNVRQGNMSREEAYAAIQDPETFAMLEDYDEQFVKAEEAAEKFKEKEQIAKIMGGIQAGNQASDDARAGEVELKKQTAKEYSNYENEGGRAVINTNLASLDEALKDFETGKVKTGLAKHLIPGDLSLEILDPNLAATRDKIRSAIVGSLRPILGGQFAEKEGERILSNSFNPRMSTTENAAKLRREIERTKQTIINKEKQFVKQGLMAQGEKSTPPRSKKESAASDPTSILNMQKAKVLALDPAEQNLYIEGISKKFNMPIDEIRKKLGIK